MYPEILRVELEDGGVFPIPLTPSTTFHDVSACVRDPGESLPVILEQSPLGARVVGSWERPLELLQLWGNLRPQISFLASYKLAHHLEADWSDDRAPLDAGLLQIDPWELYDLKDQLKELPRDKDSWDSLDSSSVMDSSTSTFNSEVFEASYNSHLGRSPIVSLESQKDQLQKLLQESRGSFQRRRFLTSSLPMRVSRPDHHSAIHPLQRFHDNGVSDKELITKPKTVGQLKRRSREPKKRNETLAHGDPGLSPDKLYPVGYGDRNLYKYSISQHERVHRSQDRSGQRPRSQSLDRKARSDPRMSDGMEYSPKHPTIKDRSHTNYEGMKDQKSSMKLVPEGGEVTVSELREMAYRQQNQIENQQQLLVAREQRLKYLKMQEGKAAQVNVESDKLRRLRERVEAQESKLRRLRALRGQVDSSGLSARSLSSDLDSMRNLFSEKEKELVMAVAKVDELTRQIEDIRTGRSVPNNQSNHLQKHHQELDKLRRELLYRNSVNREASARVTSQRESLANRKEEVHRIDKRIAELQHRLQKKRLLNQQLATQISAATQAKQAHLKAIQQKELGDGIRENSADDIATVDHRVGDGLSEFERVKQDPKYQTLPYNTKFSSSGRPGRPPYDPTGDSSPGDTSTESGTPSQNIISAPVKTLDEPQYSNQGPSRTNSQNRLQYNRADQSLSNSQNVQDNKASLPETSLSLSFGHKLSPGVTALSQNRFNQQYIKEVGASQTQHGEISPDGDNINRPQLPPKPAGRPMPPPRQKGEPGSFEVLHASPHRMTHPRPQQAFRYASGNIIMSTYTQKPEAPQTDQSESALKPEPMETAEKVHVSINRRIEMPPDFMFPENQSPPYDLIGRSDVPVVTTAPTVPAPVPPPVTQPPPSEISYPRVTSAGSTQNTHKGSVPKGKLSEIIKQSENASKSNNAESPTTNGSLSSKHFNSINANEAQDTTDDAKVQVVALEPKKYIIDKDSIEVKEQDTSENKIADDTMNNNNAAVEVENSSSAEPSDTDIPVVKRAKKGNLKSNTSKSNPRRVSFDPLALLLDASLEGELELVKKTAKEVPNPTAANDEGITALHNAICAGHLDIVTFLVLYGYDVNAQDADGWTPLHCAASCNNVEMTRFLVDHGACVLATTLLDHETAAEKCEQEEDGFDSCSQYLYSVQEKLGIMNGGVVYAVYDYEAHNEDELSFQNGDAITVLRRGDEYERQWWWSQINDKCGYIPRNLLGLYPRVKSPLRES